MDNMQNFGPEMPEEKKSHGALIGSIIVIIILIVGGIYIWQTKMKNVIQQKQNQPAAVINDNTQTSSDLDGLEQEANTIDDEAGVDASEIQ